MRLTLGKNDLISAFQIQTRVYGRAANWRLNMGYSPVIYHNVLHDIICYSFLKVNLFCCALSIQCREFHSLFSHVVFAIKI